MNASLLIDAIVHQTTVLVAQLATSAGSGAQLADTANQVFLDPANELADGGLGNEGLADGFGLGLRTYHDKFARLTEGSTERGRSLWEALLAHVQERGSVSWAQLLVHFRNDEEATVRRVLEALVDRGMLFRAGRGDLTTYRAVTAEDDALARLVRERRVTTEERDGKVLHSSAEVVIPLGHPVRWEASVFEHYQAMVTALCTKLRLGRRRRCR